MERQPSQQPTDALQSFSPKERDRRWGAVRSLMDSASIDLLLVPDQVNSRYLTQLAHQIGPTVFPRDGEVTAFGGPPSLERAAATWVQDLRPLGGSWEDPVIERLQELDADGKIIGLTGLDPLVTSPLGDLNYNSFVALRDSFPHARWVGVSALLREARRVKSAEEIACLTMAAAAGDASLGIAMGQATVGATDREVRGQMVLTLARWGSEPPQHVHLTVEPPEQVQHAPDRPVGRSLQAGDLLLAEISGRWRGYEAKAAQPAALGPVPQQWRDAWKVLLEAWERGWEALRPGARQEEIAMAVGSAKTGRFRVEPALEGQGLGDDLPLIPSRSWLRDTAQPLEPGVCFLFKPSVLWAAEGGEQRLAWGDTVVMAEHGARRLGTRPLEFIVLM